MVSMKPRRFIFFPSFQPVFNSTSNLDTTRISSCYGCRYQAVNLVDLLIHSSNIIDSTHSCRNSSNHLDTKRISSCYGCRYQAVNLVDLLIHSSNIIDSTHSCRNSSNHLDTTRISSWLRLPLLGGQPNRLTNSFVEYYRFDSLMSQLFK